MPSVRHERDRDHGIHGRHRRRAVRELLAAGHRVTGVTRSARGRERLDSLGAGAVEADVFDEASLRRAFDGADTVVNVLTHVPSADRMADPSAWEENDRIRTEASAAIARAARAAGRATARAGVDRVRVRRRRRRVARRGRAGRRRRRDDDRADGRAQRAGAVRRRHRRAALRAVHGTRQRVHAGRAGGGAGGASIAVGPPGAYRPTLWLDDAAVAVAAALGVPAGTYNVADTDPPTNAEIDAALAAAVGVEALRTRAPQDGPLARSQRCRAAGCVRRAAGRRGCARARRSGAGSAT